MRFTAASKSTLPKGVTRAEKPHSNLEGPQFSGHHLKGCSLKVSEKQGSHLQVPHGLRDLPEDEHDPLNHIMGAVPPGFAICNQPKFLLMFLQDIFQKIAHTHGMALKGEHHLSHLFYHTLYLESLFDFFINLHIQDIANRVDFLVV